MSFDPSEVDTPKLGSVGPGRECPGGTSIKDSDEFRADAVALYRASDRSSVKVIADRIGINHETLRQWIKASDGADSLHGPATSAFTMLDRYIAATCHQ